VMLLAACPLLGKPTEDQPILDRAGNAIMHLIGPTNSPFNFADGNAGRNIPTPAQCWLASHFNNATQAGYVREALAQALAEGGGKNFKPDRCFPLTLLWLPGAPAASRAPTVAAAFNGEQASAMFRTGWDAQASWLAIKGGTPAASHGHMDVGSFVYEARGQRWIHDLGSENYNLPGHFGDRRWTYFRLQNRSHNTLEIDGKLQNPTSKPCPLVDSTITGDALSAAFDLTDAYAGSAGKVVRRARFDPRSGVVKIEDEITKPAGTVVWRAYTEASAEVQGSEVILRQEGKQITLRRISAAGTWSITDAKPPTSAEKQNEEYKAVVLTVPKTERMSIVVEIQP
jgi:hypothetical protein